jgi:methionyl-tRNA formyltransferase
MKIVFMGTPDFAKTILEAIYEAGHEITAVYTQPDKPKGRSGALIMPPVKEYALSKGLKVYQPLKIKEKEEVENLKKIPADIYVVAAFGQFLSEEILNIPRFGCINAHGSLLPKLRGASPIQRSIVNGDAETGITIMKMDKGMDSGDMIKKEAIPILDSDNETTLYEKLAVLGAKMVVETLPEIEAGTATYVKQDESLVTFAPMLKKEDGKIDFNKTSREIFNLIRGICEWPTAFSFYNGKSVKIYGAFISSENVEADLKPGEMYVTKKKILVKTGDGFLELTDVQLEGKKPMKAVDFINGSHLVTGNKFDS